MLALNADGGDPIRDAAGNRLDGDWTNPTSTSDTGTSIYPSGNGVVGGDFDFRFNVLPADATQDGTVGPADLSKLLTNYGRTGMTWSQGDFTGDGVIGPAGSEQIADQLRSWLARGRSGSGTFPTITPSIAVIVPTVTDSAAALAGTECGRRGG